MSFEYFTPVGKAIDKAARNYHGQTGKYIRDYETLCAELARQDIDSSKLKDRWNRDYRIIFEVSGRNYVIRFRSDGANGVYQPNDYNPDDFDVWKSAIDYFAETEKRINRIFSQTVNSGVKEFPKTDAEFKSILGENGVKFEDLRDGFGNPVYLTFNKQFRYSDKTKLENGKQIVKPVTEELAVFSLRSDGANKTILADDFDLLTVSGVISEQSKDTKYEKADVKTITFSGAKGAIRGTVYDPNGAVIPSATVTATNEEDNAKTFSTTTNENGEFLLENLPSGKYTVKAEAVGFQSTVYSNIEVRSQNLLEIKFTLNVGGVQSTVEVTAAAEIVNVTSSQIQNLPVNGRNFSSLLKLKPGVAGKEEIINQTEQNSTPRLREYFPETLLWNPELVTDKNGRAELKFKLADNITTWKLYAIASTKNGKIGVVEKEVQAFQPFFVDLEPPKFLTEGGRIILIGKTRKFPIRIQTTRGKFGSDMNATG